MCKCSAVLSMNKRTALGVVDHEPALELLTSDCKMFTCLLCGKQVNVLLPS